VSDLKKKEKVIYINQLNLQGAWELSCYREASQLLQKTVGQEFFFTTIKSAPELSVFVC
jgi:hypothetical protein